VRRKICDILGGRSGKQTVQENGDLLTGWFASALWGMQTGFMGIL
jgi:hypothetical protein